MATKARLLMAMPTFAPLENVCCAEGLGNADEADGADVETEVVVETASIPSICLSISSVIGLLSASLHHIRKRYGKYHFRHR